MGSGWLKVSEWGGMDKRERERERRARIWLAGSERAGSR